MSSKINIWVAKRDFLSQQAVFDCDTTQILQVSRLAEAVDMSVGGLVQWRTVAGLSPNIQYIIPST